MAELLDYESQPPPLQRGPAPRGYLGSRASEEDEPEVSTVIFGACVFFGTIGFVILAAAYWWSAYTGPMP